MTTQVLFGKASGPAPTPVEKAPAPQKPSSKLKKSKSVKSPFQGKDNLNEVDFGRTFSARYAEDSSMIVIFFLWLFFGGWGGHRFYMGDKMVGFMMAGLGVFTGILIFSAGFTSIHSYLVGKGEISRGLISVLVVMGIHGTWIFFDFFYILVRKLTSR